jgi:hypothetical protein
VSQGEGEIKSECECECEFEFESEWERYASFTDVSFLKGLCGAWSEVFLPTLRP